TELEQGGDLRVIADLRTLRGSADLFGGPWASGCLSAPAGFVGANTPQVQALADGIVHALKWLQTAGPSDLIQAVPGAVVPGVPERPRRFCRRQHTAGPGAGRRHCPCLEMVANRRSV